jgi:uncharacterized protein (DUF111 family)
MKKGRPAMTISVLCAPQRADAIRQILFVESGTLGVRTSPVYKQALDRGWIEVEIHNGKVRVKVGRFEGRPITVAPEYEDCVALARETSIPAREVYEEAARSAREALERTAMP